MIVFIVPGPFSLERIIKYGISAYLFSKIFFISEIIVYLWDKLKNKKNGKDKFTETH